MTAYSPATVRSIFVTGLQNAHAVENQALALIDRQLDRLVRYPELADRLRAHRRETEQQIVRLEEILENLGSGPSTLKDMAMGLMGNMAALGNAVAADEILKNSFVNYAFENFEIASYTSLDALAEAGAFGAARSLLKASLGEEQAMARWILESLPDLTRKYAGLRSGGERAGR